MRSVAETFIRWHVLFHDYPTLSDLKKAVARGDNKSPCVSSLRSVCWKVFLLFGDFDPSRWQKTLSDSRSAYTALREHFLRNIEYPDKVGPADPLAEDNNSPWIALRQDEAIRAEIHQDVERCMPENPYFREPATKKILLDILFIFCKLNPDIGYRQGMHEVLAPILWVVEKDAIEPRSIRKHRGSDGSDGLLRDIVDAQYIEHDVFTLFSLIMQTARTFYELGDRDQGGNTLQPEMDTTVHQESPIVERSQRIHQNYLAKVDPELAERLAAIDILPQIFLIRWIRLLFGREFPFDELLRLWDALFAEDPALDLVDLICVAMLLRVRWQLVAADYSSALAILLRYPSSAEKPKAVSFVQDALYLRNNLTIAAGTQLISKYSGKSPTQLSRGDQGSAPRSKSETSGSPSSSPIRRRSGDRPRFASPASYIRRQGIDALLHDAARVVYQRGEKWGVNRAVRDAVDEVKRNMQGIQSVNTSPRPGMNHARWSLDEGRQITEQTAAAMQSSERLDERNKALAAMLEGALEELECIKLKTNMEDHAGEELETAFDSVMAKVRHVKECLYDSTITISGTEASHHKSTADLEDELPLSPGNRRPSDPKPTAIAASPDTSSDVVTPTEVHSPEAFEAAPSTPTKAPQDSTSSDDALTSSPTNLAPRPAIAESPFAWMLGESEWRSSFNASFPTPATERRESKYTRTGFLFGSPADDKAQRQREKTAADGFILSNWSGDKPSS